MTLHPETLLLLKNMPDLLRYLFCFFFVFLGPGYLLTHMLKLKRFRFLLSVSLSYSLLILNLLSLQAFGAPVAWFMPFLAVELCALVGVCILQVILEARQNKRQTSNIQPGITNQWRIMQRRLRAHILPCTLWLGIMAALVGYLAWAGPYMEIPSDSSEHVRRFQIQQAMMQGHADAAQWLPCSGNNASASIRAGNWIPNQSLVRHFFVQSHHWYFLHAWLCETSGLPMLRSFLALSLATNSMLLTGIFAFTMAMFAGLRASRTRKAWAVAIATLFMAVQMGSLVFAYIRQYALAPTMMNYILFLTGSLLAREFVTTARWRLKPIVLLGVITFAANAIHTQEAMFIFFITIAICAIAVWKAWLAPTGTGQIDQTNTPHPLAWRWKALAGLAVMLLIYGILFWRIHQLPQYPLDPRFVMPLQALVPFMHNLLIQPPMGQFYETVTVWGLFVYLVWLFGPAALRKNILLAAGMLLPLFTAFNPFTVDMITRISPHSMTQLWRVNYALPLYAVAGWLAVEAVTKLWHAQPAARRIRHLAVLLLLTGLMLPWNFKCFVQPYSRYLTLARTPINRDIRFYADLIEETLQWDRKKTILITDPLTACMLNRWTLLNAWNTGFTESHFRDFLKHTAADEEICQVIKTLDPNHVWRLIINERSGPPSATGKISRHWPKNILQTQDAYSACFKEYVKNNPDQFQLLWSQDQIAVYSITP